MSIPDRSSPQQPIRAREGVPAAAYAIGLVWINAYLFRDLFTNPTAYMNSMHGFWVALAKRGSGSWFHSNWWPYWDCGIPFEFTYAPLVPAWTAAWASFRGISHDLAFQAVTAVVLCALPLTFFLMAWLLTRSPGASFLAAVFYSLVSPTQILVPDGAFAWRGFWDARRFYLAAVWDETPHFAALALLPVVILLLSLAIRRRRPVYYWAASLSIALSTLASAFAPVVIVMAAFCLLFVLRRGHYPRNIAITAAIGAFGYAIAAPFLSPTLLSSIQTAAAGSGEGWTMGSVTAIALVAIGWIVLWRYLPRWTGDWQVQFFALFAYLASMPPILATYLHHEFLPQPNRYKFEMEMALALALAFGIRPLFNRASRPLQAALLLLIVGLAGEQIVTHRKYVKNVLYPRDITRTIEYRASTWAEQNLGGIRVMLPGSIAQWANDFTNVTQYSGGSWSVAYNPIQQRGLEGIFNGGDTPGKDARVSLAWLKAYGVGAVAVSGPKSEETWKPYAHPEKFEGVLPVLWRSDDVTFYQVPQRSSLAHVVPVPAIVKREPRGPRDIAGIEPFTAALDDPTLPAASFAWEGSNRVRISATAARGQAIAVQMTYHPGWRAWTGGRRLAIQRDGLGLMWLQPDCSGQCDIVLAYDGGWELRLCRTLSFAALAALLVWPMVMLWRKHSGSTTTS